GLLRWLEERDDGTGPVVPGRIQDRHGSQQRAGVVVVAAGMHRGHPLTLRVELGMLRGVVHLGGFGDGQAVEVRAHEHGRAVAVAQHRGDAVAADTGRDRPVGEALQLLLDTLGSLLLRPRELRVGVEVFIQVLLPAQICRGVGDDRARGGWSGHGALPFLRSTLLRAGSPGGVFAHAGSGWSTARTEPARAALEPVAAAPCRGGTARPYAPG